MKTAHESGLLGRLDLNLFRVFAMIYQQRNLTRAAQLLHLSQSAVSHALARLREQLGDPLFVREGRGVLPTPLAEQLAPGILDALDSLQDSLRTLQSFDPAQARRRVRLNMPEQMEPLLLPQAIACLAEQAPLLQVHSSSLHWPSCAANWNWDGSTWPWKSPAPPTPSCASASCCRSRCV